MKNDKIVVYILLVCLLLSLLAISYNLFIPYLWFDEAGQFYMAKGLNHYSAPFSLENGLASVIENNKHFNLDPGGFSILLHYWTIISNHHVWLRLLPFLFFLGLIAAFIYLSYKWTKKKEVALLMGFIPILIPWVMSMGFEVRAYSMECLGTVLGIVALEWLRNQVTMKRLLTWSLVFSVFMLSRYSEIVVVFVVSIYVLYLILKSGEKNKRKVLYLVIYSLPILVTLAYIYFFALIYQNKGIEPLSYLPYLSKDPSILLQPLNLFFLDALAVLIWLFFNKKKYPVVQKYEALLFVTLSVNLLFIVLSFMGKYPWTAKSTRCISLFLLVALSYSALAGELFSYMIDKRPRLKGYIVAVYTTVALVGLFMLYLAKEPLYHRSTNDNNTYTSLLNVDLSQYNAVYVDYGETPCVRYLFEYGAFKKTASISYPAPFIFAKKGFEPQDIKDLYNYDAVISSVNKLDEKSKEWKLKAGTANFYIRSTTVR